MKYKDIKGYEGLYQISEDGVVRSLDRVTTGVNGREYYNKGVTLKSSNNKGYLQVRLYKDNGSRTIPIHRLIATTYVPNPNNLPQVNHKDGNKKNNHYTNIEWCTPSENTQHAFDTGLATPTRGETNGQAKLTDEIVIGIRKVHNTGKYMQREIAEMYGIKDAQVSRIVNNKRWAHLPSCEDLKGIE